MDGSINNGVQVVSTAPATNAGGLDIPTTSFPNYGLDNFTLRIAPNSVAAQMVSITGEADSITPAGFASYSLSYYDGTRNVPIPVPDSYRDKTLSPTDPNQPYKSVKPVPAGGILAWWNVAGLNGLYTVTLAVVDGSGNINYAYQSVEVGQKVTQSAVSMGSPSGSPFYNLQDPYHRLTVEFPDSSSVSFPSGTDGKILAVDAMPASLLPVAQPPSVIPVLPILEIQPRHTVCTLARRELPTTLSSVRSHALTNWPPWGFPSASSSRILPP